MSDEIQALRHGRLIEPMPGLALVAASIDGAGNPVALWERAPHAREFWATRQGGGGDVQVVRVPEMPAGRGVFIQSMPDGGFVIVRSSDRSSDSLVSRSHRASVLVIDERGEVRREGDFGSGMSHVQADSAGNVWVGYGDTGIFSSPENAAAVSGLARFNADCELAWRHVPDRDAHAIADCYALNVTDRETFSYYYQLFPILRVRQGGGTYWETDHAGASAVVVADDRIALVGGYGSDRRKIVVGKLGDTAFEMTAKRRLSVGDAKPESIRGAPIGRGNELHVLAGREWMKWSLE